jgi:ribosome-associated protein
MTMRSTPATEPTIQLDQFMKLSGMVGTGGQAKLVIQGGEVLLNGMVETRRKKKLKTGDEVTFNGQTIAVAFEE